MKHVFEKKHKHTEYRRNFRTPCSGSPAMISTQFSKRQLTNKTYTAAIFNVDVASQCNESLFARSSRDVRNDYL